MTTDLDWQAIWDTHAPYHRDGESRIPLPNGKVVKLKAGAGFGDLSHPTTALSLSLLGRNMATCVDVGTGTGILAIAAALLGAKKVYAYEIDPESIKHAQENIALNKLEDIISLNPQKPPSSFDQLSINMISSEQKIALNSYPFLNNCLHTRIVSGILQEEEIAFLSNFNHGKLLEKKCNGEWVGYTFLHST